MRIMTSYDTRPQDSLKKINLNHSWEIPGDLQYHKFCLQVNSIETVAADLMIIDELQLLSERKKVICERPALGQDSGLVSLPAI